MKRTYLIIAGLIALAVVLIAAQYLLTSKERYDKQTEADLNVISEAINSHYRNTKQVETDLNSLDLSQALLGRAKERNYEVKKIPNSLSETTYSRSDIRIELCADFKTDKSKNTSSYPFYNNHSVGFDCVEQTIYGY